MTDPVETTTRVVSSVDDLHSAWSFVMTQLDQMGDDIQEVSIKRYWRFSYDIPEDSGAVRYSVAVEKFVSEEEK